MRMQHKLCAEMLIFSLNGKIRNDNIFLEMESRLIYICHKDKEYAAAMCARLSLLLGGLRLAAACPQQVPEGQESYIMEQYMSAEKAALELSERFAPDCVVRGLGECSLIGMCSASGGSGLTSAALSLGHIYSQLYGSRTLYLSFDALSEKCGRQIPGALRGIYSLAFGEEEAQESCIYKDPMGLFRLASEGEINPCSFLDGRSAVAMLTRLSKRFERIVADVPLSSACAFDVLDVCDSITVCFGWQEERHKLGEILMGHLKRMRSGVLSFVPHYDECGTEDIYGQFGSEVRELAQRLEDL